MVMALLCSGTAAAIPALAEPMRPVEGEAIAAYLNSINYSNPKPKVLVVASRTATTREAFVGSDPDAKQLAADLPQATAAVIANFLRVAGFSTEVDIPRHLVRAELQWRVAPEPALDRIFGTEPLSDAWNRFYREYPEASGITRFSRVGIDEKSGQALFYISAKPGGHGGAGFFVLLQPRFGIWRILASKVAWVS